MGIVLIHFYLQHLKLYCLFLGNTCKISSGFFLTGVLSQALKSCFAYTPQISLGKQITKKKTKQTHTHTHTHTHTR